ncbi:response regulator, partial [Candidatus Peregrinibacteria bacterium]|nr:response regulator [Candidatus Peregrinibacteria bacterium]
CKVIVANNGQEALDIYEENKPDIILMDIQMPVMDGITSMKELRSKHKDLPPVIAVSANALEGDAEKYIALGMNDYISKPIIGNTLQKKLKQWLKPSKINIQNTNSVTEKKKNPDEKKLNKKTAALNEDELTLIDSETINSIKIQAGNDESFLKMLFESFIEDSEILLEEINKGLTENDTPMIKNSVHSFKGLSGTIGAVELHKKSTLINNELKKNDHKIITSELEELKTLYYLTKKKIKKLYL